MTSLTGGNPTENTSSTHGSQIAFQPLVVECQGGRQEIHAHEVRTEELRRDVIARLAGTHVRHCDVSGLLARPEQDRQAGIQFCVALGAAHAAMTFSAGGEQSGGADLFAAMLSAIEEVTNPTHRQAAIWSAVEAGALMHPNGWRVISSNVLETVRACELRSYHIQEFLDHAQRFVSAVHGDEEGNLLPRVIDLWPDAPVPPETVLPSGWQGSCSGLLRSDARPEEAINSRVVISRRMRDDREAICFLEVAWDRDGVWQRRVVCRSDVAAASKIVELAAYGLPVTANNAHDFIAFLADFESANLEAISETLVSGKMGWVGSHGERGFLWGSRLIAAVQSSDVAPIEQHVHFRGADAGDEQWAGALVAGGSFEEWQAGISLLQPHSRAMLAVYTSLVPPLLMVVGAPNFVLSFAGPTSSGKTTTLYCAAATWGRPLGGGGESVIRNWDATRVGIERSLNVLDCLPFLIDDTKQARRPEDVAQTVYDVVGGTGRTRGSVKGLAATGAWRTVMITTGEQPLTSFTDDGGTRARVLEIWGAPLGPSSPDMAEQVAILRQVFSHNFGHAGPYFVYCLIYNRASWPELRTRYAELCRTYEERAGSNGVAARLAANLAAIELAAELSHSLAIIPGPYDGAVSALWDELTREAAEADRAEAAMLSVLNYTVQFRQQFQSGRASSETTQAGYLGIWSTIVTSDGEQVRVRALFVNACNDILTELGHDPHSVRRTWRDRQWTVTNPQKLTFKTRVNGSVVDVVAIRESAIAELMDAHVEPSTAGPRGLLGGSGGGGENRENM